MSGHTTMKRDGGWTIELVIPIDGISEISIQPSSLEQMLRWDAEEIPSVLALLSELSGVAEVSLRRLAGQDSDRVLDAFFRVVPSGVRDDFREKKRPLASPYEFLTPEQRYEAVDQPDPVDPRFPRVEGEVIRAMPKPAPVPQPQPKPPVQEEFGPADDTGGLVMDNPTIMQRVG